MIRKIVVIFAALILIPFLFAGCNKEYGINLRYVEYQKVMPTKGDVKKEFFGYIKAGGETELSFQTEGQITSLNFTDGDSVKKGQIIATIDNEINILNEAEQRIRIEDAKVKYENAKSYYERMEKLHAVGAISDKDWEAAKTNMESSRNQIDIAKQIYSSARKRVNFGTLYAPSDGIILKKMMEINQYAKPGQTVVIFQDNRKSEAKLFISEKYINNVEVGQEVDLHIKDVKNAPKKAVIVNMTKTSIDAGSYRVTLRLKEKYPELKDGMAISATINLKKPDAPKIKIPVNAVLEDENSSYVWMLTNIDKGTAQIKRQNIKTGNMVNDFITVENGIYRGDMIVTKGVGEIMDGQKVKIREEFD